MLIVQIVEYMAVDKEMQLAVIKLSNGGLNVSIIAKKLPLSIFTTVQIIKRWKITRKISHDISSGQPQSFTRPEDRMLRRIDL